MKRPLVRRVVLVLGVFALLLGVIAGGAAVFLVSLGSSFDDGRRIIPSTQAFPAPSTRPSAGSGAAQNILLLGSDTRGPAPRSLADIRGQRSDTMILLHVPADGRHMYLVSFLRDSWLDIPGHGKGKLNAAFSYGGVPLTVQVMERLLDVRIDHVAVVSFSGFRGLTDALGGVTVRNGFAFDNLGFHLAKGDVTLNGSQALAFVRARYPPLADHQLLQSEPAAV